jgi:RimJ/RimL family protein N-acetyltransferase
MLQPLGDDFLGSWPRLAMSGGAYLAAARWLPPRSARQALEWIEKRDEDFVFSLRRPGLPDGLAALVRVDRRSRRGQLVLLPAGDEDEGWDGGSSQALGELVAFAFGEAGLRKCEWQLPGSWERARAAADLLGFQLEAGLPGALLQAGGAEDLLLLGLRGEYPGEVGR